jgi:hypothetical protein
VWRRISTALYFSADQQRGSGVFEDELFLRIGFQRDGILIK